MLGFTVNLLKFKLSAFAKYPLEKKFVISNRTPGKSLTNLSQIVLVFAG